MRVLVFDTDSCGLNFSLRCMDEGHTVRMWSSPKHSGERPPLGTGLVERVSDWKSNMKWADIVVCTQNNHYLDDLEPFFNQGYPIFGTNKQAAQLELDRGAGMKAFEHVGISLPKYQKFSGPKEALAHVEKTRKAYVLKPWGGADDKATTYVSHSWKDMAFVLERMIKCGERGEFILQELVDGIEMAVSGWFGPGGFSDYVEENWEEKKFMNDGLGCNTGEQGTTMRYVRGSESLLFKRVLEPFAEYLHALRYVGSVDVNCIIDEKGQAWPLEFTMRMGWPSFNIHMSMLDCDPVDWMADLLDGKDTFKPSRKTTVGIVLTHKDFPHCKAPQHEACGYPVWGVTAKNMDHIHWVEAMRGDGKYKDIIVTAGAMPCIVTGNAYTVHQALAEALAVAKELSWSSNKMHRTDIGKRLEKQLPELQKHGYASGMRF